MKIANISWKKEIIITTHEGNFCGAKNPSFLHYVVQPDY